MLNMSESSRRGPFKRAVGRTYWKSILIQLVALTISYNYDAAGRLISVAYSDGQKAAYSYDDAGNISYYSSDGSMPSGVSPLLLLLDGE